MSPYPSDVEWQKGKAASIEVSCKVRHRCDVIQTPDRNSPKSDHGRSSHARTESGMKMGMKPRRRR